MTKTLMIICTLFAFCFNACSTKGYANSSGATGYTEWRLDF
ncbi:hypothetical protein [Helicobacter winghamensis]